MDASFLARLQFALTIGFHYIFPPFSIGLGLILVFMEGAYLKTKNPIYEKITRFWVKIFALIFAIGVATGIVMEFQFGTNWSNYSRYVGDVFGSALAAEGIFAFFLESGFLAVLVFGWDKVSPKVHFFSTIMVAFGATFSAIWIVVANSWMQTPAGFHIVGEGINARAEVTSFWEMVLNPSSIDRLTHTLSAAWLTGAFLVLSVSAYYVLKKKHYEFARESMKIALLVAVVASLLQLFTGHQSAVGIAENQPEKLAAIEAHYDSLAPANLSLFGWVDENTKEVKFGVALPGMLSYLIYGDSEAPVKGLNAFKPEDLPPVNIVFQTYHLMVAIGFTLIMISFLGLFYIYKQTLVKQKWLLWIFVFAVLGPQIANQVGWATAEIGRQPWIVYGLMRTSEAASVVVNSGQIIFSIILFTFIYLLLFVLFIYLLNEKIKLGPDIPEEIRSEYQRQKRILERPTFMKNKNNPGEK